MHERGAPPASAAVPCGDISIYKSHYPPRTNNTYRPPPQYPLLLPHNAASSPLLNEYPPLLVPSMPLLLDLWRVHFTPCPFYMLIFSIHLTEFISDQMCEKPDSAAAWTEQLLYDMAERNLCVKKLKQAVQAEKTLTKDFMFLLVSQSK